MRKIGNCTLITAIAMVVLATGCAGRQKGPTPERVPITTAPTPIADVVSVSNSEFDPLISLIGTIRTDVPPSDFPIKEWKVVTFIDKKTRVVVHELIFKDYYRSNGWRFWDGASTSNAEQMHVSVIARDVVGCTAQSCQHQEAISARFPPGSLERAASGDKLQLRLTAKNVDPFFVTITEGQARVQLEETARVLREMPPK